MLLLLLSMTPDQIVCLTAPSTSKRSMKITLVIDGFSAQAENMTFSYVDDPVIESISPRKSFKG